MSGKERLILLDKIKEGVTGIQISLRKIKIDLQYELITLDAHATVLAENEVPPDDVKLIGLCLHDISKNINEILKRISPD